MSDSLWSHELLHARLSCPSLSPRVCSNSCPLSQWCHPTISSSVSSFSSCPQSFPASGSFSVSLLSTSGVQSMETSASLLPTNIQVWFPIGLTCLISLLIKDLWSLFQNNSSKASSLWCSAFFTIQLSHLYMTPGNGKIIALMIDLCQQSDVSAF